MSDSTLLLQILIAFGGGVVSFLSPCVLPLLPGYLSMMSGYSVAELEAGEASRRRMLGVIGLFILGFTVVFASFGATASSLGRFLSSNLPVATRIAGVVIMVFGLVMVGLSFTNKGLLGFFDRDARMTVRPSRLGSWAAPTMGAAFAFGWTPCIGPILTVILAAASTRETILQGVALLTAYSLGLGVPFLLAALGLRRVFRRIRPYLRTINVVAGLGLTAFGLVMFTGNLSRISSFVSGFFFNLPFLERLAQV